MMSLLILESFPQIAYRRAQQVLGFESLQPVLTGIGHEALTEQGLQCPLVGKLLLQITEARIQRQIIYFQRRTNIAQGIFLEGPD